MAEKDTTSVFYVKNMTCSSCEQRVIKTLSPIDGITKVKASHVNGKITLIHSASFVGMDTVKKQCETLGYPVVQNKTQALFIQWLRTLAILLGIIAGYWLLSQTGIFYLFPMADQNTALPMLFIIGLLTSVHCVAMCGGINISQCAKSTHNAGKKNNPLKPSFLYNAGRVLSYTLIGGLVGGLGSVVTPSGKLKGIVAIGAGVFMLIMGLNLLHLFPSLRKFVPRMPQKFSAAIESQKGGKGPFIVGILNGFMPCGPLQAMQLYALSTGSVVSGALSMFLFSLGTVPLMFGLGAVSTLLSEKFTNSMVKVSAVLVVLLGLMMLNNGLALSGFTTFF